MPGDEIRVIDMMGKTITHVVASGNSATIDLSANAAGIYAIQTLRNGTALKTVQLIKQ